MNDNVIEDGKTLELTQELARVLMRSIRAQPGRVSLSDMAGIRRLEAAAYQGELSENLADAIASTRRALVRLNAGGRNTRQTRLVLAVAE